MDAPEDARVEARLRELLPTAATAQNPLDYTALIWGDDRALSDILVTVADDPGIERVLVLYDQPARMEGAVERVRIGEDGQVRAHVIGDGAPAGRPSR